LEKKGFLVWFGKPLIVTFLNLLPRGPFGNIENLFQGQLGNQNKGLPCLKARIETKIMPLLPKEALLGGSFIIIKESLMPGKLEGSQKEDQGMATLKEANFNQT